MALSGSFYGTQLAYQQLYFTWSASQNVGANQSTVTLNMYLKGSYGLYISGRSDATETIAGSTYTVSTPAISQSSSSGWTVYLSSVSQTVNHNADGTLSINLSGWFPIRATLSGTYYDSFSGSTTVTLDTIPRASTPSLSAGTTALGSAVTIYTNRASTAFTHTISYAYGNIGKTTIASGVADSTAWTLPNSLASETPSSTGGTGTIYCDTYNGATLIGSKQISFSTSIPNSSTFQPSVGSVATAELTTGVTNLALGAGKYVQNLSNVRLTISGIAGVYGSTVSSVKITFNGTTYTASVSGGTATWDTGVLGSSGTLSYSVTCTDSRGYTDASPTTGSITVVGYGTPYISSFSAKRCDVNGNIDEIGTYLKITRNGSATSLKDGSAVEKNTLACTVAWSPKGANSWTTMTEYTVSASSTLSITTAVAKTTKSDFAITTAYDIKFTLTDKFNNTVSVQTVTVGTVMMSWGKSGVGIGKVISPTSGFALEVGGSILVNAGAGIWSAYNNNYMLFDHNNGNVTVNATGADLYLGYQNTAKVRLSTSMYTYDGGRLILKNDGSGLELSGGAGNNFIELGRASGSSTPYIDFHSYSTYTDYDVRLIATGGNGTSGTGTLIMYAGSVQWNGTTIGLQGSGAYGNSDTNGFRSATIDLGNGFTIYQCGAIIPANTYSQINFPAGTFSTTPVINITPAIPGNDYTTYTSTGSWGLMAYNNTMVKVVNYDSAKQKYVMITAIGKN